MSSLTTLPQPHRPPDDDLRLAVIVIFAGLDRAVLRATIATAEGQVLDLAGWIDELHDVARHELAEMLAFPAGDREDHPVSGSLTKGADRAGHAPIISNKA